ncbi:MAG TPA: DUF3313 family protein [Myxococcota bacterium]|nr:DUF3313 family protein [Myxococcota bacterium]
MNIQGLARLYLAVLVFALCGCATEQKLEQEVLAASPAPDSGFLEDADRMAPHPERAPFDRYWLAPTFDWNHYSKVYVAAVDTRHVLEMSLWEKINLRTIDVKKDIADLALEFHDDLVKAFRDDPKRHFQVLDAAAAIDDQTLVIQSALVELVPDKAALAVLGTAAWAAPVALGVPLGTFAAFEDQGSVSFELRGRDGRTGEVVGMCADREVGPMRVLDLRSMTWYGNAHLILNDWSRQLVELSNTPHDVQVKHSEYFTLMPW